MGKKKTEAPTLEVYTPKPHANISLNKEMKLPKCDVGDRVSLVVTGVVTGLRSDEFGKSVDLDVKGVSVDRGMRGDLDTAKRRHTADEG